LEKCPGGGGVATQLSDVRKLPHRRVRRYCYHVPRRDAVKNPIPFKPEVPNYAIPILPCPRRSRHASSLRCYRGGRPSPVRPPSPTGTSSSPASAARSLSATFPSPSPKRPSTTPARHLPPCRRLTHRARRLQSHPLRRWRLRPDAAYRQRTGHGPQWRHIYHTAPHPHRPNDYLFLADSGVPHCRNLSCAGEAGQRGCDSDECRH